MGLWSTNKELEGQIILLHQGLSEIDILKRKVSDLEHAIVLLRTDQSNLRGMFSRKLEGIAKEERKEAKKEETSKNSETFNSYPFLKF